MSRAGDGRAQAGEKGDQGGAAGSAQLRDSPGWDLGSYPRE